jgi:hypothetical protein
VRERDAVILTRSLENISTVYARDNELVVEADAEQYALITSKVNRELLEELVREKGNLYLIVSNTEKKPGSVKNDIENLEKLIGKENLKIEK